MKTLYICGDSFGCSDPDYGVCWVDILTEKIKNKFTVVNLCQVCASNLHIGAQIDRAILNKSDFIIYLMTSSIRDDVKYKTSNFKEILYRFTGNRVGESDADIVSFSAASINDHSKLTNDQKRLLNDYLNEFFDIDLSIYKNELIIEGILSRLKASGIPFVYDQGGFENSNFLKTKSKPYFEKYSKNKTLINLWNFESNRTYRPYYHIADPDVHQTIAEYYVNLLNEI